MSHLFLPSNRGWKRLDRVQLLANLSAASVESLLIARGVSTLAIRKLATCWGSGISSVALLLFGRSRTPRAATLCYCVALAGNSLHSSGFSSNYLEVGGEDTALLNGVGNTIANLPSFVVPYLTLALRRRFDGSFMPICALGAALKIAAGLAFCCCASVEPAANRLAPRIWVGSGKRDGIEHGRTRYLDE